MPLPAGGLIMAGPPVPPGCAWGLRRRCGDLCTGPSPGTDNGFHLTLPAHSPPSLGPALGSWAPQARPAPFSGLHLAPAAIRRHWYGFSLPLEPPSAGGDFVDWLVHCNKNLVTMSLLIFPAKLFWSIKSSQLRALVLGLLL